MDITIKIDESLVLQIIKYANDLNMNFNEAVESLCLEALANNDEKEFMVLDDTQTEDLVNELIEFAISNFDSASPGFKLSELYIHTKGKWMDLSPSYRKKLGREFMKRALLNEKIHKGRKIVYFFEKNINNTAIYKVGVTNK